jgi:putative hydroxymethylpyrimidine transport system permease protein
VTLEEVALGYLLALAVGITIALIVASSVHVRRAVLPLLVISQTIPMVLLAPILAILIGYGLEPKLLIVAIVCFFPIVVNAVDGFDAADPELVRMMRTLNAGGVAIFRRVVFPGALPSIFAGARIAATYAAIGAVSGAPDRANLRRGHRAVGDRPRAVWTRLPRRAPAHPLDPSTDPPLGGRTCAGSPFSRLPHSLSRSAR